MSRPCPTSVARLLAGACAAAAVAAWVTGRRAEVVVVLAIALLVVAHEAGHFVAAVAARIRVDEAALGMGPVVLGHTDRTGRRWTVRALPVGGFVRMPGMTAAPTADGGDAPAVVASARRAGRTFAAASHRRRTAVALAGPAANLVTAALLLTAAGIAGLPQRGTTVAAVLPGSPAATAGFLPGDRLVEVGGCCTPAEGAPRAVRSWAQLEASVATAEPLRLVVARDGRTIELTARPERRGDRAVLGLRPFTTPARESAVTALRRAPGRLTDAAVDTARAAVAGVAAMPGMVRAAATGSEPPAARAVSALGAVQLGGLVADDGAGAVLVLLARISLALALVNLLPLLPLDGGLALQALVEGAARRVRGRPVVLPARLSRACTAVVAGLIGVGVGSALLTDLLHPVAG